MFGPLMLLALLAGATPAREQAYPVARRDSLVEELHGTRVADPYRWLERLDDPATVRWVDAQSRRSNASLATLPGHAVARRRLEALWTFRHTNVPWREAGRLFYLEAPSVGKQPVLYSVATPGARPSVVFDPQVLSPDGSTSYDEYAVSPDGRWLSYAVSRGGADLAEMHVRDLTTGHERDDVVRGSWGGACWTFDGGGYFYMRPPEPRSGDSPETPRVEKQLCYHVLGQPQAKDRMLHEWTDNVRWVYTMMSDDGRYAIAVAERGSTARMYAMDLGDARAPNLAAALVPVLGDREAGQTPLGTAGSVLYVTTDLDAPRGKVVAVDLAGGSVRTVIPESNAVIQTAIVAGDRLVLHVLEDVKSRLLLYDLAGKPAGEVALPGIGAVEWPVNGRHSAPEFWYSFTSYLQPSTVYRHDLKTGKSAAFRAPRVPFDPAPYETRQVFFRSKDGTRVPMFVTARRGLKLDGDHPALLTAYGGFGTVVTPAFRPDLPLWLESGGIYAVANIRGGGEYGEEWHRAGGLERKQTSFDDFYSAAEALVAQGWTQPSRLAIYGHSNGGLLIGAALTQRPELFAAAVPNAGHYDMLRFHRFTVGAGWIPEYGSPDSADAFRVLRAYSPLHNVHAGTCYPATLLLAADHDDRVVPSHAYKFAATLQAAQACDRSILLRVARDASHSYASGSAAVAEATDVWTFVAAHTGTTLR